MARGPIEIPIAVDTGGVQKAINNGLIEPVKDAEDALKRLEGTDAGRDIERAMDRAQDSTEDLSRELDSTRRDLDKLGFAARDAGDAGSTGMDRIRGGAAEVQREVGQNLGETVSSIRGDFSDLGQVGQDTLGGLAATVSSMGPLGLAGAFALAAGAVGLGAFTAGQTEAKEKQEELNAAAAQWADAYVGSAGRIVDASHIVAEIQAIATDPERYQQAKDAAKEWGVDTSVAMGALAGDSTALAVAQEGLQARIRDANAEMSDAERSVGALGAEYSSLPDDIKAGQDRMDELNGTMAQGREQARDAAAALFDYAAATGTATDKTDDLGNKIVTLPDGKEIVIDAETQTAYEDLDAIERRKLAEKTQGVRVVVDSTAWDNWTPRAKAAQIAIHGPASWQ